MLLSFLHNTSMDLSILLDMASFDCLRTTLPAESTAAAALRQAGVFEKGRRFPGGAALIECDEKEARELLAHAQTRCPESVQAITKAFRVAKLTP